MKKLILLIILITFSNISKGVIINNDSIVNIAKEVYKKWSKYSDKKLVIIVDFSRPMEQDRLFIVDIDKSEIILSSKVCHGIGSGETSVPTKFSNIEESKMSSKGVMITKETYLGYFGYSMKIEGLQSTNSNVRKRSIIFHSSLKLSTPWSWGCFSTPEENNKKIINMTKNGTLIFSFSNKNDIKNI